MTKPPEKIRIVVDGNELQLKEFKKGMCFYEYTLSETKLNMILPMPIEQLEKMLDNRICEPIN